MPRRQDEFERVALPHIRGLLRFARRLTGDSAAAEDLVQDALLLAWRSFHQLQPGTNARAWLFRILVNVWHGVGRKALRAAVPEFHAVPSREAPEFHEALEINEALDRLPAEQRAALMLAVVEGFTCKECSEILEIPIGTVMSRLSRARQALRETLRVECRVAMAGGGKTSR